MRLSLGGQDGLAWVLSRLAGLCFWHGDHEQAKRLFDESLGVFRKVNNLWGVSMALSGLETVVLAQGELAEALAVMRRVANPWGLGFAIEAFALLAVAERDLVRGATLLGATESTFKHLRFLLSPLEREERLRTVAAARAALGAADFDTHFTAGQALSLDQAIEYALAQPA